MADNVTHPVTGTGTADVKQRTDDLGAAGHVPYVKLMDGTDNGTQVVGASASGLNVDIAGMSMTSITVGGKDGGGVTPTVNPIGIAGRDGTNVQWVKTDTAGELQVDIVSQVPGTGATNLGKAEDAGHTTGDVGVMVLAVRNDAHAALSGTDLDYTPIAVDAEGNVRVCGSVPHDTLDADDPIKVGHKAIAHGTNPTAVAAADRTDWYANRAGVPFVMGGHPNIVTVRHTLITTAVTDAAIITITAGLKIVVTRITCTLDNASTVFPTVSIGFGTATVPTGTGNLVYHGGVPAGGGFTFGDGSGILGIGADNEDLRVTTTGNATGNGLAINVSYYTIES
jgi:hypothetical protein